MENAQWAEEGDPNYCLSQREGLWVKPRRAKAQHPAAGTGHRGGTGVETPTPLSGQEGSEKVCVSLSSPPAGKAKCSNSDIYLPYKNNQRKKKLYIFYLILKQKRYKSKPSKNPSSHLVHHPTIPITPAENSRCALCLPKKNSSP